jgi:hypothetical protein
MVAQLNGAKRTKAIFVPSGDQAGWKSALALSVSCVRPVPSGLIE